MERHLKLAPEISGKDAEAFLDSLNTPPTEEQKRMSAGVAAVVQQRKNVAVRHVQEILDKHYDQQSVRSDVIALLIVEKLWNFR